jgi:hypothetical protein
MRIVERGHRLSRVYRGHIVDHRFYVYLCITGYYDTIPKGKRSPSQDSTMLSSSSNKSFVSDASTNSVISASNAALLFGAPGSTALMS